MEKKKYGPKVGAKNRDVTSKRYISRKAEFGTPSGKRVSPRPFAPKTSSFKPTYKPNGDDRGATTSYSKKPYSKPVYEKNPYTTATVRPNSTGYVKKSYSPRASGTSTSERPAFVRTPGAVRGAHLGKAGYAPKAGAAPYITSGGKKVYSKRGESRDQKGFKPVFKSVVPNKPKTASASWGSVASWYDKHLNEADTYHEKVILPNLIRLIDGDAGDHILDIACGQGFFTRALAKTGAKVEGIDVAEELIAIAKTQSPLIPFHVGSAKTLTMFKDKTFNKALISLSIQNIEHVENVIAEAARVLKHGGALHIVMNHPAFRIPKQSSWDYDDKAHLQYRRVDQYLSNSNTAIDMHPGFSDSPQTISYHRPLQFYFKAFTKAGFVVARLEEWASHKGSDSGPRANAENNARKEIPLFLYLQAEKR